jgi:hypothetical protein
MRILAWEMGKCGSFLFKPTNPNPTQHDPHGPDDPFRTIHYHRLDISGHDGMDEQDVGWRKGLVLMRILAWEMGKCGG